jgi:hypothetical protein
MILWFTILSCGPHVRFDHGLYDIATIIQLNLGELLFTSDTAQLYVGMGPGRSLVLIGGASAPANSSLESPRKPRCCSPRPLQTVGR